MTPPATVRGPGTRREQFVGCSTSRGGRALLHPAPPLRYGGAPKGRGLAHGTDASMAKEVRAPGTAHPRTTRTYRGAQGARANRAARRSALALLALPPQERSLPGPGELKWQRKEEIYYVRALCLHTAHNVRILDASNGRRRQTRQSSWPLCTA